MNKKVKLLALLLSVTMLICAMPIMGFAASPITIGQVDVTESGDLYNVTVNYSVTGDVAQQTTVLVTKTATLDTTGDTNILYIDQMDKSASFTFAVAKADVVDNKIYIKMGGSNVTEPTDVFEKTVASTSTGFTVSGYVAAYASGATVTLGTKTANTGTDGYFTLTEVADGTYTLEITAKAALKRSIPVTVSGSNVEVSTSTKKIDLMYGDIDNNNKIDNNDLMTIKGLFNKVSSAPEYNANADLDDSGKIDNNDLMTIKGLFNKTPSAYGDFVKE